MKTLITTTLLSTLLALPAGAATIALGDVTTNLDGTIFFDDARTGGSDTTVQDNSGNNPLNIQRYLDFDTDGSILDNPGPGTLTIQSFGFATSASAAANDASQVRLTFLYLGADENPGTAADNVLIGSEIVNYNHTVDGEYFVDLDTDPSAFIDGLGSRIRVVVEVLDLNPTLQETIRFKSRPVNEQSFSGQKLGHGGPVFSLSGTFVPVPEPSSLVTLALAAFTCSARPGRRR